MVIGEQDLAVCWSHVKLGRDGGDGDGARDDLLVGREDDGGTDLGVLALRVEQFHPDDAAAGGRGHGRLRVRTACLPGRTTPLAVAIAWPVLPGAPASAGTTRQR